ncbi:MAG: hypothetical protein KKB51_24450 [Candidatus Riflebacteria bacterium]|nr:hypothetical protein [Candidatus Riflebacteria bacterium]
MVGKFTSVKEEQIYIFHLEGYVEKTVAIELKEQFKAQWQKGTRQFLFDFSKATLINSVALSEVLEIISDAIGEPDVMLYICQIPEKCYWGISSLGILNHMTEFNTFAEAAKELGLKHDQ